MHAQPEEPRRQGNPHQSDRHHHQGGKLLDARRAVLAVLAVLALAACAPGTSGSGPQPTSTHQAPIHVAPGYQGMISISFSTTTSYQQAMTIVQNAGLKLAVPCPNAGPIIANATPKPTDQKDTFAQTHKLTAVGDPHLTRAMLDQVAAAPEVTSVDELPPVACPL